MMTKLRIGWLAVAVSVGATAGAAPAQSCPDCGTRCGVRAKISSAWARRSPRAWIQSWCTQKPANVCPGSCFGYFRTQWTPWNQACPNWGTTCAEPPIGAMAQTAPVALPPVPAPVSAIPPAGSNSAPAQAPSAVTPARTSPVKPAAPEQAPAPQPAPENKTFAPIPVLPPQPINPGLPLAPTPDLPRS
jgi:hypothetical protein